MKVDYKKIFRYSVLCKQTNKLLLETNNIEVAIKKSVLKNGVIYEQTRFDAMKRLQKIMFYKINYGSCNLSQFDYPNLLVECK